MYSCTCIYVHTQTVKKQSEIFSNVVVQYIQFLHGTYCFLHHSHTTCMYTCTHVHCMYHTQCIMCRNFRGWNISLVKFSWLKSPTKIGRHENFATVTVCSMERWLLSSEKKLCVHEYHVYNNILWEAAVGKTLVYVRDLRNAHDSYAAAGSNYSWWQNFRGFTFRGWGDPRKFQHYKNFCVYNSHNYVHVLAIVAFSMLGWTVRI